MHDTGCLGLVHWDDPEGWYGEGGAKSYSRTLLVVQWIMEKNLPADAGDTGSIPGLGRFHMLRSNEAHALGPTSCSH